MYTLFWLFSIFMVKKYDFLKVVQIPYPKNRFLVILRSFFSTYNLFSGRGGIFLFFTFTVEFFNEKLSSLAGLKKSCSIFRKSTDFAQFWLPGSTIKVDFINVQANFQKILLQFPEGDC